MPEVVPPQVKTVQFATNQEMLAHDALLQLAENNFNRLHPQPSCNLQENSHYLFAATGVEGVSAASESVEGNQGGRTGFQCRFNSLGG
jgi:hypothetical protein